MGGCLNSGGATATLALGVERSLSGRRWLWRPADSRVGLAVAQRLGVPEIVGRLLAARGVGIDEAAGFLDPTLRALLPDPSVLKDMDAAAARLADAIQRCETVGVFGDYDVDGACSGALVVSLLRSFGCEVVAHVPDRLTEGYGPNLPALRNLAARSATLIVCVDCGTAAADVLHALERSIDVIVLDHHKSDSVPSSIVATVNPNRLDCRSGQTMLCATGVAFLTAVATVRALRRAGYFAARPEPDLIALLDLVALATVCDVMPLTGLNRALVTQGLKVMGRRERPGISALLEAAQVRDRPTASTLGFALGPRINAAGRISEADLGMRLLLTEDPVEARSLAATLDAVNRQRQQVETGVLETAMEDAKLQLEAGHAVVLVASEAWHAGVVGIVAGRIKERFNRPACVAAVSDRVAKGSGRSVPGLDLGSAVIAARQSGLLTTGGGHPMAAGFTVPESRLAEFHAYLDSYLADARLLPGAADVSIDGSLSIPACTQELAVQVGRLAPFGPGNAEPVFALARAQVVRADRVGKDNATIRAFIEGEGGGTRVKAMAFRAKEGPLADALLARNPGPLHLVGHLRAEEWNGSLNTSFIITDVANP